MLVREVTPSITGIGALGKRDYCLILSFLRVCGDENSIAILAIALHLHSLDNSPVGDDSVIPHTSHSTVRYFNVLIEPGIYPVTSAAWTALKRQALLNFQKSQFV